MLPASERGAPGDDVTAIEKDNEITLQSEAGIRLGRTTATISQSRIRNNNVGIYGIGDSAPVIRGNFILKNDQDGITIEGAFCPVIEDNQVNHNGGRGILVSDVRGCQVQGNTVNANAVTESASTQAASR